MASAGYLHVGIAASEVGGDLKASLPAHGVVCVLDVGEDPAVSLVKYLITLACVGMEEYDGHAMPK